MKEEITGHHEIVAEKPFLRHFDVKRRSWVANQFYHVIRSGVSNVRGVVLGVTAHARDECYRLSRPLSYPAPWREDQRAKFEELLERLQEFLSEATEYAQQCLDWEALPGELRQQAKQTRSAEYARESMHGKAATDKQRKLLEKLGVEQAPADRLEASLLIDRLMQGETP